jgi:hypothetical protein
MQFWLLCEETGSPRSLPMQVSHAGFWSRHLFIEASTNRKLGSFHLRQRLRQLGQIAVCFQSGVF